MKCVNYDCDAALRHNVFFAIISVWVFFFLVNVLHVYNIHSHKSVANEI